MKQLKFFLIGGMVMAFTACNDSEIDGLATTEVDLATETTVESALEDTDVIIDAALDVSIASGGRIDNGDVEVLQCAEVTHDTEAQTITVDYGDGCEGPRGRVRRGRLLITYDGDRFTEGSFRTVTFDDFFVDETQIEGTRTHTVTTVDSDSGVYTVDIALVGGKMTFDDGTSITREASRTRTTNLGLGIENFTTVNASASGLNREGVAYSMETTTPLTFKRACRFERIFVPVSGVKVRTVGDVTVTIDYGDGACDNLAVVTSSDGTVEEIELEIRGRRRGR
ncbi:MAG: hypothetical protein AAGA85_22890 [Bacteroidota bacterium]